MTTSEQANRCGCSCRSCLPCSVLSLKRAIKIDWPAVAGATGFDIDGRGPATDQRVSERPIAFQTDATAMETAAVAALLPWQRRRSPSRNFERVAALEPVRGKQTYLPTCIILSSESTTYSGSFCQPHRNLCISYSSPFTHASSSLFHSHHIRRPSLLGCSTTAQIKIHR